MAERAGKWLRVSTDQQDEQNQEPAVDQWIADRGYELAGTYRVHGKSAYHGRQEPELREAMADMAAGRITVLVVWKSDRLERRGARALMGLIAEAAEAGGRIEFVTEPALNMSSDAVAGPMLQAFYGAVAHHESVTKSERVRAAHTVRRAAGSATGKAPYGYMILDTDERIAAGTTRRSVRKVLTPDPETAPVVKAIFHAYLDGQTMRQIALRLDADGIPSALGGQWDPKVISQILRNATYAGRLVSASGATVGRCEAIVDAGTWQAVQARSRLLGRRAGKPNSRTSAWLTGLLRCARCGGPMYRITAGKHEYMRCHGTAKNPSRCALMIRLADLESAAITLVADLAAEQGGILRITEQVAPRDIAAEIGQVDLEIAGLLPRLQDHDITAEVFASETQRLLAERQRLADAPRDGGHERVVSDGLALAGHWQAMDGPKRRRLLADAGYAFRAGKREDGRWTLDLTDRHGNLLAAMTSD
jgi:DNA invertase Pin-like site-specific DNA recombinase